MSEFAKSNPELDALISKSNSPCDIREMAVQALQDAGVITRSREEGNYGVRMTGLQAAPTPESSLPAGSQPAPTCIRVIYPHLNDRYEITGSSENELDQKEARIRQMYNS